jgi:hypothetical protein
MTFSFSAPRFTEADERYELEHLTEEERLDAWRDVYGKSEPSEETREMLQHAQEAVEKALKRIPNKQAYLAALEACPDVVKTESPAIRFLRSENYDASRAAERLVKYWDLRKVVFGEKAFLPMTLKGGCLMEQDAESLRLGHFCLLPPDKFGRTVLYECRGHLDDTGLDYASLLRAQLYMIHVALEQETAQTNGVVIVANNRGILPNHFSRKHEKLLWTAVTSCLPIQVKAIHCCYPKSFMDLFLPVLKQIFGRHLRLRHVVHDDGSESELRYSLEQYGLSEESLPHPFLGSYKLDPTTWVDERLQSEESTRRPHYRSKSCDAKLMQSSSMLDQPLETLIPPEEPMAPRRVSHWALLSSLT